MEKTRNKLGEARFFLQKLQEESQKSVRNQPEAFGYYLSAFLGAARSVTWVLQEEAKDQYDAWFPGWLEKLKAEEKELLGFMKDQRNIEVKQGKTETSRKDKAVPAELVPGVQVFGPPAMFFGEAHLKRTKELGLPSGTQAWVYIPEWYFEHEGKATQVVELGQRYIAILQRLLGEFKEAYPEAPQ